MRTIELYGQTLSITAVHKTIAICSNLYPTQHHLTLLTPMYNLLASSADLAYINCYLSQHAHTQHGMSLIELCVEFRLLNYRRISTILTVHMT